MPTLTPPEIAVADPGTTEDGTFQSSKDGLTMYYQRWLPTSTTTSSSPPRAQVVFVHGFIEHYGRYQNIFKLFAQAGIAITAFDQRGFGRTWKQHPNPRKAHGNTTWKQQFEDIADMVRLERARLDERYAKDSVPIFLCGHSMGGGLAYAFFTRPPGSPEDPDKEVKDMIKGVILSSPWITLTNPPPSLLTWIGQKVLRVFPDFPYYATVAVKEISTDVEVQKWTTADPYVDGHIYLKCIQGPLLGGVKMLQEEYKNWPEDKALLCAHGSTDPVTSFKGSRELVEKTKASDKEHKEFDKLLHECWHAEGDAKIRFTEYIIDWIKARS